MAYLLNDIYSASGSGKLFGCWTEAVTKFHPGSFYNYEQDNMPLYDLDERDEFLWEQLGYPTSSIPGIVLLVSGDATEEAVGCNKNIFYDLSSALKVLPKYLNYPMIIEVANFGNLGDLVIRDITMGPSGSLEIINKTTYAIPVISGVECSATSRVTTGPHAAYSNLWKSVSATSNDSLFKFFANQSGGSPSSLVTSGPIFSGLDGTQTDARIRSGAYKAFYGSRPGSQTTTNQEFMRLSVADLTFQQSFTTSLDVTASVYEEQPLTEISLYDPSSYLQYEPLDVANETYRTHTYTAGDESTRQRFVAYGNSLNKIIVSRCNGPIYIRGFYCSGNGITSQIGVDVTDSTVSFDTLAVDHYVSKGIKIKNSTVDFKRDLFVNRCYALDGSNNRLSGNWAAINRVTERPKKDESAGIEAINSEIYFDTTEEHTSNLGTFLAGNFLRVISRNSTGMRLLNSVVRGGKGRSSAEHLSPSGFQVMDFLFVEGNANYGLELENSRFNFDGRLEVFNNTRGVLAKNSDLNIEEFTIENNHLYGLNLDSCEFTYNTNGVSATTRFDYTSLTLNPAYLYTKQYAYKFQKNGQHMLLKNSSFKPNRYGPGMENYYGRLMFIEAHGVTDINDNLLPGIELESSVAELINSTSLRQGLTDKIAKGAHIYAKNGSEITTLGTASSMCSFVAGATPPETYGKMHYYAAICVEDNSTARFRGPTIIFDGAVNVYANKNSNIIFEPHKKKTGEFDVEGFSLTNPRSHTMVELKGYNSCLVVDRSSNIVMEDLGDYQTLWGPADLVDTNYDTSTTLNFTPYVSAGFFQFYPNPNEAVDYAEFSQVLSTRGNNCRMEATGNNKFWFAANHWDDDEFSLSAVTEGGVCLRALNNSNVRVRNVHFPCGWWNASATHYDSSALSQFCCRLFIWNIANNSTMHVDHVSVSSVYPASAGYHGPSALWVSGPSQDPVYSAPSSTPDTSSLAVLDFFGCGSGHPNAWPLPDGTSAMYGQLTFENQGPFRIYKGVDSLANSLVFGGGYGIIQQLFAQGYSASSEAYAGDAALSGVYGKALRITDAGTLQLSGFYYPNEFVDSNPNAIILDESAANLFANAKNGAMGTSNRPQICMIYSAKTNASGESRSANAGIKGKGFKGSNIFDLLEES